VKRLFLFVFFAAAVPGATPALPTWTGNPVRAAMELETQWAQVARPESTVGIRGLLRFALEATGVDWHPERVAVALARARTMQDLDPASPTLGNFQWRSDHGRVLDHNGVEFAMQLLGLLHRRYAARLSPAARDHMEALLSDGIAGLRSHRVRIDYTNIFVMKAWGLISAGEALGRADVAADGYGRFDEWLRHTARHGIGEYGGVTYYGIDLDSLALIARFAGRPEVQTQARAAIRYLWTDIAANWWAPGDRLGGANARSYDYLFGTGYLEAHTWTAGWLRVRPALEGAGWLGGVQPNQSVLRDAVMLPPPAEWTEPIRAQLPRTVVQRWGEKPEQRAVHWMGRRISLASSGASRGTDERTLVANLGDSPAVPQLTLFMDGRGDPFGTKKIANAAGQAKSLHLTPFIATVQRGPELLQLLSSEPLAPGTRYKPGELACFLTHLTVPREAEVWVGDTLTGPGTPERPVLIPADQAVFLRLGDAALAVKILLATATDGSPAPIQWIEDSPLSPARRLTIVHATSEPAGRGTVAVWMRAGEWLDAGRYAAWRRAFGAGLSRTHLAGNRVTVDVDGVAGPLRLEVDISRGERPTLSGGEPEALLGVNGVDWGREISRGWAR
jgi:hypothetical protein